MAGNGNHPLNTDHFDDLTLEEFVLGQLLPDQEDAIRQHLDQCALCRAKVAAYRAFCRQVSGELNKSLDQATPSPELNFDRIAEGWRKPRHSFNLRYRLRAAAPGVSLGLVAVLLVLAVLLLFPSEDAVALRRLDLADQYDGPPAVLAVSTSSGLALVRLSPGEAAQIISRWGFVNEPRSLRFSPGGDWLAFQEGRTLHILHVHETGSHATLPVHDLADWAWSPDGTRLAYTDGVGQLSVFDVVTQTARIVVPADESAWGSPVWSADGQQIAYAVVVPLPFGAGAIQRQGIWRVDLQTGYRVELARNPYPEDVVWMPARWVGTGTHILAWDVKGAIDHNTTSLYWIDTAAHSVAQIDGYVLAHGMQLAWPVSEQDEILAMERGRLAAMDLSTQTRYPIREFIPWPQTLDWAPNGAWVAYTAAGAAAGKGLYLFALQDQELRQVDLPNDALEKAVIWAGAEHVFVLRQSAGEGYSDVWLVSLTDDDTPPQRILAGVELPATDHYNGWRWSDVLAAQVVTQD